MSIGLFSVTLYVMGTPTRSLLTARRCSAFSSRRRGAGRPDDGRGMCVIVAVFLVAFALFLRTDSGSRCGPPG